MKAGRRAAQRQPVPAWRRSHPRKTTRREEWRRQPRPPGEPGTAWSSRGDVHRVSLYALGAAPAIGPALVGAEGRLLGRVYQSGSLRHAMADQVRFVYTGIRVRNLPRSLRFIGRSDSEW